jgi:DNA uptake protein ComE-like DNA-binding protein
MIAFAPATALAANDPAANQVVETIHFNQATAEKLQSLAGVGPAELAKYKKQLTVE